MGVFSYYEDHAAANLINWLNIFSYPLEVILDPTTGVVLRNSQLQLIMETLL